MPELPTDRIEQFLREHPGLPTPFLVIDLDVVAERYRMLCEALPRAAVYYAVKANPDPAVVRLLVELGCDFDVASPAEVELCLGHGARADQLSYGNTVKKEADILRAAGRGVTTFALDCAQELHKLIRSAPGSVAMVRLAVDGAGADWPLSRKFGCGPQDALTLLRSAAAARHPVGIGFQVGSQQHDPDAWDAPLAQVAVLAEALAADGVRLTAVNLGGGLPSLHADPTPGLDRFLVGDAGLLRAEVVLTSRRDSDPGRRWVYLDVGMFSGLVETAEEAIRYRIRVPRPHGPTGPAVLAGPTCDSLDVPCSTSADPTHCRWTCAPATGSTCSPPAPTPPRTPRWGSTGSNRCAPTTFRRRARRPSAPGPSRASRPPPSRTAQLLPDPGQGGPELLDLRGGERVEHRRADRGHVPRGGRLDRGHSLVGQDAPHPASVLVAGTAPDQAALFHPGDGVGEPAARVHHALGQLGHPQLPVRVFGELHEDLVLGRGQCALLGQLAVHPLVEQPGHVEVGAPDHLLRGRQPPRLAHLLRNHSATSPAQ